MEISRRAVRKFCDVNSDACRSPEPISRRNKTQRRRSDRCTDPKKEHTHATISTVSAARAHAHTLTMGLSGRPSPSRPLSCYFTSVTRGFFLTGETEEKRYTPSDLRRNSSGCLSSSVSQSSRNRLPGGRFPTIRLRDPIMSADFGADKPKGAKDPYDLRATVSDTIAGATVEVRRGPRGKRKREGYPKVVLDGGGAPLSVCAELCPVWYVGKCRPRMRCGGH